MLVTSPNSPPAGHPGLQVELAIGRAAQVAGGRIDHAIGNAQPVEQPALQAREAGPSIASLSSGSVKANISTLVNWWTRNSPRVARPWAPASVRKQWLMPQSLMRQPLGVERLAGQHPAEGDLGRGHQAQVGVLDAVDLRLRPAGNEADAGQDVVPREVRRRRRA